MGSEAMMRGEHYLVVVRGDDAIPLSIHDDYDEAVAAARKVAADPEGAMPEGDWVHRNALGRNWWSLGDPICVCVFHFDDGRVVECEGIRLDENGEGVAPDAAGTGSD
jgi:hypothetical protein